MNNGDRVDVTVSGREVGLGTIIDASHDPVKVVVETRYRGPYQFAASRNFFVALTPGRWKIDMPSQTSREFSPNG